jgi:hypothetical protein
MFIVQEIAKIRGGLALFLKCLALLASLATLIPAHTLEGQTGALRPPALAQTSYFNEVAAEPETSSQESIDLNGGTLSWTETLSTGRCGNEGEGSYSILTYSNFVYSYQFPSAFYTNPQEYIPRLREFARDCRVYLQRHAESAVLPSRWRGAGRWRRHVR